MLRKEFKDVFIQSIAFLAMSILILLILKVVFWSQEVSYFELYFIPLQLELIIFAVFVGGALFLSDKRQNAVDYMLSLPYTRLTLLMVKTIPRITVVVIFYLLFLYVQMTAANFALALSPLSFTLFYFALFFISLSLSASFENYISIMLVTALASFIFIAFLLLLPMAVGKIILGVNILNVENMVFYLKELFNLDPYNFRNLGGAWGLTKFSGIGVCLVAPFVIAFVFAFKKIGIQPVKQFNKRFLKVFTPLFALGILISSLLSYSIIPSYNTRYFLTKDNYLLETRGDHTRVYHQDEVFDAEGIFVLPYMGIIDYHNSLYSVYWDGKYSYYARLNLKTKKSEVLYRMESYPFSRGIWLYQNKLIITTHSQYTPDKQLVFVDLNTKESSVMSLGGKLPQRYYTPQLFGAGQVNGKTFWLICSEMETADPIILLWEDGKTENLGMSDKYPLYLNQMLITYSGDKLVFRKITDTGVETVATVPIPNGFYLNGSRPVILNNVECKENLGVTYKGFLRGRYFRLDFDKFQLEELTAYNTLLATGKQFDTGYRIRKLRTAGRDFLLAYNDWEPHARIFKSLAIYRVDIKTGDASLVKKFELGKFAQKGDGIHYFKSGILVKQDNKIRAYDFPHLKKLSFPALE